MQSQNLLYRFLNMTCGSWRNAFYVDCISCPYEDRHCTGHLLATNAEGIPLLLSVPYFEEMSGDKVDKFECAAIITKEAFESLYDRWLSWNVTKPKECSILQILPETDEYTP